MPLYEYQCDECRNSFEKLVSFSEANHSPTCPVCQGRQTRKKISKVAAFSPGSSSGSGVSTGCASTGRFS